MKEKQLCRLFLVESAIKAPHEIRKTFMGLNLSGAGDLHHLHVLSQDPIENGDWFISTDTSSALSRFPKLCDELDAFHSPAFVAKNKDLMKIIASTNEQLDVAKIPLKFLESYVKDPHDYAVIEYTAKDLNEIGKFEKKTHDRENKSYPPSHIDRWYDYIPKLNKGYIKILPSKEKWNRIEMIEVLASFRKELFPNTTVEKEVVEEWLKKQLTM